MLSDNINSLLFPKITIVTPNYNQAKYLEKTILSVVNQKYPNLEYIVIDGGSTDESISIIKKYEHLITYWESAKDNGMYYALQKGFELSTGDVMGWINSDDYLHPNSLFLIAKIFNDQPEVSWIQGLPNISNIYGSIVYCRIFKQYCKLDFVLNLNNKEWIQQESTFWRKELYIKAGNKIETKYKYAGDFDLWVRFFQFEKLYSLNVLLGTFRLTNNNSSVVNNLSYEKEAREIISNIKLNNIENQLMNRLNNVGLINKLKNFIYKPNKSNLFNYPKQLMYNFSSNRFDFK